MNITQIEYFMTLADRKSFKKAAEYLNVSTAAVSKQISMLEEEWGFKIFVRHYKDVELTPSGEIMYKMMINSTQNYSTALLSAIQQANEDKIIISIGIIEKLNLDYIYTALGHIQERYKNVTLYIESIMAQDLIFKQAGGKFDMIITHEHLMHNVSHIEKHIIGKLQHALIISKNHPNYREVLSGRAMTETIFYPSSDKIDRYSSDFQFIVSTYGFKPKTIVGMPNLDSILIAVKGGGGVAFLDTGIWLQPEFELAVIPTGIYFNEIVVWPSLPKDSVINDIGNSLVKEIHELRKGQFEN